MTTLTLEIADSAAHELHREAAALDITVSELVEMLAEQISDGGAGIYVLNDGEIAKVKAAMDDPTPSISHEQVMGEIDRLLDRKT